jgi:protein-L-isoaspartate(D-aspartate) O-methyltransferase
MALAAVAPMQTSPASQIHEYALLRRAMVDSQLKVTKVTDEAVIRSMGRVARETFVPQDFAARAYADENVPLGAGRVLMQPIVLARLLSAVTPRYGDRALIVGAGCGYSTAVLADIGLTVTALESDVAIARKAADAVVDAGYPQVVSITDLGSAAGPFDLILIDGAVEHIPETLIALLAPSGSLITVLVENQIGRGIIGRKSATGDFGVNAFMDALLPVLPEFVKPKSFSF